MIVIVSDFACVNGGQAKVAIDSACLLAQSGHDVIFFAAAGPAAPQLTHPRIKVILLDQQDILSEPDRWVASMRGLWNAGAARALKSLLDGLDPATTVLHCHSLAKAMSAAIGPLLTDGPIRCVYTMHDYFLACPNGGFYDYQKQEICTRKALGVSCLTTHCDVRQRSHKAWRVVRQAITWGPGKLPRGLKDIIYISKTQRRVIEPYLSDKTRLHHVPNPIAKSDLPPADTAANDIFLFVGAFAPQKGAVMFARAARELGVKAVFVGQGSDEEAIRLANPAAEIVSWQTPEQVQVWLGRAKALVFPSLWYEGQPLVPLEAMARGVPVVCGDWSAAIESIQDGVNGIVYHEATIPALMEAMLRVVHLPKFSPSDVSQDMSGAAHLSRLLAVYNGLLAD